MLTAIMKNGERICLGDRWEKQKLLYLREKEIFYCPYCHEKVLLKLGEKRIFHFSHMKSTQCEFHHEGESQYHLNGKLQLYHWLKEQHVNPIVEFFDSKIKQKADIVFFTDNKKFVLEFQCSNINVATLYKRTKKYKSSGYHPIWILGANQFNRKSTYITSFTDFHYLFLQTTTSKTWIIPFYCSQSKKFILHHSIQPISIRNAFSNKRIVDLERMNLSSLLSPTSHFMTICKDLWWKELKQLKNNLIKYPKAFQNPLLKELYQHNLNLFLLPPYIGLPVDNSPSILTPPLIWQAFLFIDVFLKREINTPIRFHEVYMAFIRRTHQNHIQLRQLPLIHDGQASLAVHQYLQHLVNIQLLNKLNYHTYMMNHKMPLPTTIDQLTEMELFFNKKFSKIIF